MLVQSPNIIIQPSQNIVGQGQDVICSISIPPDVDPDTIELGWLNEDDIITDDSRVTIIESIHDSTNNVITTVIQFNPLYEDDEGTYSCYSVVNELETFTSIRLQNFKSELVIMHLHSYHFHTLDQRNLPMYISLIDLQSVIYP